MVRVNRDQEPVNFTKEKVSLQTCRWISSPNSLTLFRDRNVLLMDLKKRKMKK
jgi:hypothetical protein